MEEILEGFMNKSITSMDCRENKVCFCCANPYSFWNNEIALTNPSKVNALSISVKSAL